MTRSGKECTSVKSPPRERRVGPHSTAARICVPARSTPTTNGRRSESADLLAQCELRRPLHLCLFAPARFHIPASTRREWLKWQSGLLPLETSTLPHLRVLSQYPSTRFLNGLFALSHLAFFVVSFVGSRYCSEKRRSNASSPTSPSLLLSTCSNGTTLQLVGVEDQYTVIVFYSDPSHTSIFTDALTFSRGFPLQRDRVRPHSSNVPPRPREDHPRTSLQ